MARTEHIWVPYAFVACCVRDEASVRLLLVSRKRATLAQGCALDLLQTSDGARATFTRTLCVGLTTSAMSAALDTLLRDPRTVSPRPSTALFKLGRAGGWERAAETPRVFVCPTWTRRAPTGATRALTEENIVVEVSSREIQGSRA